MKLRVCFVSSLALLTLASPALHAEEDGLYVDFSLSTVDLDFGGASIQPGPSGSVNPDLERATSLGVAGGYNLGRWALELEYWQSNGEYDVSYSNANGTSRDRYHLDDFRVSGVFRSSGQWYFLGKLGLSFPDLDIDATGLRLNLGDSVFYGIGGGLRFNDNTALELEVTGTQDETTAVNLGFRVHF